MAAHGFRKRFNTILKNNKEGNIALKEKLMGHRGVFVLDGSYHDPDVKTLFEEFRIHIQNLTIDDSERLRIKNQKLEAELSEKQKLEDEVKRQQQSIDYLLRKDAERDALQDSPHRKP